MTTLLTVLNTIVSIVSSYLGIILPTLGAIGAWYGIKQRKLKITRVNCYLISACGKEEPIFFKKLPLADIETNRLCNLLDLLLGAGKFVTMLFLHKDFLQQLKDIHTNTSISELRKKYGETRDGKKAVYLPLIDKDFVRGKKRLLLLQQKSMEAINSVYKTKKVEKLSRKTPLENLAEPTVVVRDEDY